MNLWIIHGVATNVLILDYDKATDVLLLIFNAPNRRKIDNHYETVPMTFIVVNRTLITVTNQQTKYLYFEIKII